jgi:hypothetical protein
LSALTPKPVQPNPSLESRTHKGRPRSTERTLSVPRGLPLRSATSVSSASTSLKTRSSQSRTSAGSGGVSCARTLDTVHAHIAVLPIAVAMAMATICGTSNLIVAFRMRCLACARLVLLTWNQDNPEVRRIQALPWPQRAKDSPSQVSCRAERSAVFIAEPDFGSCRSSFLQYCWGVSMPPGMHLPSGFRLEAACLGAPRGNSQAR